MHFSASSLHSSYDYTTPESCAFSSNLTPGSDRMKKIQTFENVLVEKLVFGGKGFARVDWKVVFITGWAVPGARVNLRVLKKRKDFSETQITEILEKSPLETGSFPLFVGAPWLNIAYESQLEIKQKQIEESFFHIRKYQEHINFLPIIAAPEIYGYRNKIEFSFGKYISHREEIFQNFNVGFHKQGEFSKVEDYESCILIDEEQNKLYKRIKDYAKNSGIPVYDQKMWTGFWRHLMIRKMYFSWEILVVLSVYPKYFENSSDSQKVFEDIKYFLTSLSQEFSTLHSVYLSHNGNIADTLIGDLELVYGESVIHETLLGLTFDIGPQSFFQTNSRGAELLYSCVKDFAHIASFKTGTVLDLYAGTGTIGMIFSDISQEVVSVELVKEASENGAKNAVKNGITNMKFVNAKVEEFLEGYLKEGYTADLLIIDPPRAGMHPSTLPSVLKFNTEQILYVSCNPATLARDLQYILENSNYQIEKVQAVDMFPHTHHIETVVSLIKKMKA